MTDLNNWLKASYSAMVDEGHLDFLGHMNNIAYLEIFEKARWQMITERGYGLEKINELKKGPVILQILIQFKKEVRLRQNLIIESRVVSYEGKIGKIKQQMLSESGDIHCEAEFLIGLFDIAERKLVLPTLEWRAACGEVI